MLEAGATYFSDRGRRTAYRSRRPLQPGKSLTRWPVSDSLTGWVMVPVRNRAPTEVATWNGATMRRRSLAGIRLAARGSDAAGDPPIQPLGVVGGLDAQHDRQQLAAAPERAHSVGEVPRRCETAHEAAVEPIRQTLATSVVLLDRAATRDHRSSWRSTRGNERIGIERVVKEVDPCLDFRGMPSNGRRHGVDRQRFRLVVDENRANAPPTDVVAEEPQRRERDSDTVERSRAHRFGAVRLEGSRHPDRTASTVANVGPFVARGEPCVQDAVVLLQLVGVAGLAVPFEVLGGSDGHAMRRAYAPRDQVMVGELADAKRDVDAFLHQVHESIVELQVHAQQRVTPHEEA